MKYFTNLFHNLPLIKLIPILIFFFSLNIPAQTPQFYNYENVGSSSNSFPFGQSAGKLVDWLFLPEEINQPTIPPAGDLIVKVYFFMTTSGARDFTDLVVMMAQDTTTSFVTGQFYQGEMDTVYYSQNASLSSVALTWMGIELDTPFPYDPSKSLILAVGQCGAVGSGMNIRQNPLTNTGLRRVWSVGGCPFTPYAGGDFSIVNFGIDVVPVPVELISFSATTDSKNVNLNWATATEINNSGFKIERKYDRTDWLEIGFVPGHGTTTEKQNYSYIDQNVNAGIYSYRLKQVDFDGTFKYSNEILVNFTAPLEFTLDQNFPNPFNPSTTINYSIPNSSFVQLIVYNSIGQEIAILVNEIIEGGNHSVDFDASNLPSGIYLYKLTASGTNGNEFQNIKKMILLK
jgi:hypothetical protein